MDELNSVTFDKTNDMGYYRLDVPGVETITWAFGDEPRKIRENDTQYVVELNEDNEEAVMAMHDIVELEPEDYAEYEEDVTNWIKRIGGHPPSKP